jgi:hypothetical protein
MWSKIMCNDHMFLLKTMTIEKNTKLKTIKLPRNSYSKQWPTDASYYWYKTKSWVG